MTQKRKNIQSLMRLSSVVAILFVLYYIPVASIFVGA
jgi:hypothetical protein